MARFFGEVGYGIPTEVRPGVWEDLIKEHSYYGDVERAGRQIREGEKVNFDLNISNSISIVADAFANTHFFAIRYVRWAGALWIVKNVEIKAPRLTMHIGGGYNGPTPKTAGPPGDDTGD